MKKIALILIAGSVMLGFQSFADTIDNKIDDAMKTFQDNGTFDSLSNAEIESVHNLVKNQVIGLDLKPEHVDQAILGQLVSGAISALRGLAGKALGFLSGVASSIMSKIMSVIGTKGSAIVGHLVGSVKGITGDQVKAVAKKVAEEAAVGMAGNAIASLATSAIHEVTGKTPPPEATKEALQAGEEAAAKADEK